jgi:hypothetical protein
LGRNDVARASRCDWLPDLGSRRSKPLMPERNEPVIVAVRALNDLSECGGRKSKQNGGQNKYLLNQILSNLVLSRVHWVEPRLVAEITYLTWPADNVLRHPATPRSASRMKRTPIAR